MIRSQKVVVTIVGILVASAGCVHAQEAFHRRGSKPLPALAVITVHVEKSFNGKVIENAAVIFHATRDARDDGSMEVKTDPSGDARMDLIEVGSHVNLQVIADGFATFAEELDIDSATKQLTVKMLRPREQISAYEDNDGKASVRTLGVQEPPKPLSSVVRSAPVLAKAASLSGTVKDATGVRIPGAIVTILNTGVATSGPLKQATDANGGYARPRLEAGTYMIRIEAPGFQTVTHTDFVMDAGANYVINDTLQTASATTPPPANTQPATPRL
jgi:hypothetical protein